MLEFNINNMVQVRLTVRGRGLLRENRQKLRDAQPLLPESILTVAEDADGWSRWQLWELMSEFGQYIHNGADLVIETMIRIPLAESMDRSKPPPGYGVFEHEFDDDTLSLWVFQLATEPPPEGYRGRRSSDRSKVLAWAWEHFDARASAEREPAC